MSFNLEKLEDNTSPFIRTLRIVLLVLIIIGTALIIMRDTWMPSVVEYILTIS